MYDVWHNVQIFKFPKNLVEIAFGNYCGFSVGPLCVVQLYVQRCKESRFAVDHARVLRTSL